MKQIAAFFACLQLLVLGSPALAQAGGETYSVVHSGARTVVTQSWTEEWDPVSGQWVRVGDDTASAPAQVHAATRYAQPVAPRTAAPALAQYGPFIVTSPTSAALVGSTDTRSPEQFDTMLRDFPHLALLEMVEAPGTSNDIANLAVARRIRAHGIATHVPSNGSVRSGAVELFLSGSTRTMDEGAQFAVHSWLDNYGREASDFPADHPTHRLYLDFYVEMGMSERQAREFYAMTNSVPHRSALWLDAAAMRPWIREEQAPILVAQSNPAQTTEPAEPVLTLNSVPLAPVLDYGDLSLIILASLERQRPLAA